MATDVFHIDANGVRISAQRAVFGEHTYATRNIQRVERIEDKGIRWPGTGTLFIGFASIAAGLIMGSTVALIIGAVAVLSGSLNLARKRSKYGVRITTHRGPVYVLASADKRYVEVVADALLRAVSAAPHSPDAPQAAAADPAVAPDAPAMRRGGRPTPRRRRR